MMKHQPNPGQTPSAQSRDTPIWQTAQTRAAMHEEIQAEVDEAMWQTLLTPDKTYFECQTCGAVVMSPITHVQWHRKMDDA